MLYRELSRLSPDVFFHPVWRHFNQAKIRFSPGLVNDLLGVGQQLISEGDMATACQVFFLCAALQKSLHQYQAALITAQQAWSLAEIYNFPKVAEWAAWSSCAICLLQGQIERASQHLQWLETHLKNQGDWVLADTLEILGGSLSSEPKDDGNSGSLMDWLKRWGEPPSSIETSQTVPSNFYEREDFLRPPLAKSSDGEAVVTSSGSQNGYQNGSRHAESLLKRFQSAWRLIKNIAAGKVHLKWIIDEDPISTEAETPPKSIELLLPQNPASVRIPINNFPSRRELPPMPPVIQTIDEPPSPRGTPLHERTEETSLPAHTPVPPPLYTQLEISALEKQLKVFYLGGFRILYNEQPIDNWPGRKGQLLFKYLIMNHRLHISRDILMDIFWPDTDPESARNNLNVSLHGLRQALRSVINLPIVLFDNGTYHLNPDLIIWTDVEEFERHIEAGHQCEAIGQLTPALQEYEMAAKLYQGDFLAEDPYEDWPVMTRERLRVGYLDLLDRLSHIYFNQAQYTACVTLCQLMLDRDHCREDAHCLLMRCYSRQDQHYLAMRQYQACVEALRSELDVDPEPATTQLAERIRRHEPV